jgi:predicted Zn finger-like uncharacterized protein
MKIECDKCGAKYSIADEKVRGKTFKIRCKKCSNVIIVRDKVAAEAAAGDDGGSAGYDEPAQAQPGWHLAINGETVGPMSEDEVRQRYEAAEIDKDTAIWQEGFEDWLPLGDVDAFADLPDHGGGGAADDPFASANQDEYAAPRAGGFAAAAAPVASGFAAAAAPRDPEPQSPRVSALTGQRNENSVLFSLDSLQALATGGGGGGAAAAAAAPRKPAGTTARGLATAAPSSEGSGLIDIRALGAMVGQDQPSAAGSAGPSLRSGAEDAALPSFGGAGLGGLAATPLVPQTTPVEHAAAAAVPARSNAPLYFMMALMLLMVAGMAAYVFVFKEEPKEKIVEREVHVVPDVKSAGKDDEDKDKDEKKDDEEDEDEDEDEGEAQAGADGTKKPAGKTGKSKTSSSKTSPSSSSSSSSSTPSTSSSSSSSSTPKKEDSSLDVDCILNPELAKCKSSSSKSAPKAPSGASDPSLPEKLSKSDIKAGVDKVLSQAKSCGSKHGAKPGEVVRVRISISGASGTVSSASAQDPHNGTPLGNCVAAALKSATFSKFRSGSMGAVYPVRM